MNSSDLSDFYKQLSLLVKSNLPLSDGLKRLGLSYRKKAFKEILLELGEETAKGKTLADAMEKYPKHFSEFHIMMIRAGENSGNLSEVLFETAEISKVHHNLRNMLRDILLYPLVAVWSALLILFLMGIFLLPIYKEIFDELLWGLPLPPITELVMDISGFCLNYKYLCSAFFIISLLFIIDTAFAGWGISKISFRMFLVWNIFRNLMMARFCSIWSLLVTQQVPANKAFRIAGDMMEDKHFRKALCRAAESCENGMDICEALEQESLIPKLIPLTVLYVPGDELDRELNILSGIFKNKAAFQIKKSAVILTVISFLIMTFVSGIAVLALFMPLIRTVGPLGK